MITALIFVPALSAVLLIFVPGRRTMFIKVFSLMASFIPLLIGLWLFIRFNPTYPLPQFVENSPWIGLGLSYHVGADGISLMLLLLTSLLSPLAVASSFSYIKEREKEYYIMLLLLQTGMAGVFAAQNLFLFYIFWEAMLIPMYFLIGIWGGERKLYATVKFVLYTMVGSLLMLVGIIYLWKISPEHSLYFYNLYSLSIPPGAQILLFLAFALAFAIKVPLFPFHTWLPDAHTEAPTAGSVLLAGVLLKMGGYGFLRLAMPLFPHAFRVFFPYLVALAIFSIIYGAAMAFVQRDAKRLVAYSSVSHLGVVMLGIFILSFKAYTGGIYQMLNHGLSTGALFLLIGMLYERTHTRDMEALGGLARPLPVIAGFLMVTVFSSIGLPGLNGFVGEFLVFLGSFEVSKTAGAFAALGVILSAVYLLWMYRRVMQGPVKNPSHLNLPSMNLREVLIMLPIVILFFWMGLYPRFFMGKFERSARFMMEITQQKYKVVSVIQQEDLR